MNTSLFSYAYPRPSVTADIAITWRNQVLVIERGNDPFLGQFSLPGGFCNEGERISSTAVRELQEETGIRLNAKELGFIGIYDTPKRDPRGWTISHLYHKHFGHDKNSRPRVNAADDAVGHEWLNAFDILDGKIQLAFDHNEMVEAVWNWKLSES